MQDIAILLEALPFLRQYKGKTFVLKLGGEVIQDPENLHQIAADVALMNKVGIRILLVHGGGPQANELSERLGLKPVFVAGRRVTDEATLEITKMVFAGKINTDIISALRRVGAQAVGLSGVDANLVHASRRPVKRMKDPESGVESDVDFGHVGDIISVDVSLLRILLDHEYVPVLSSLGADEDGHIYNINADTVAAELAQGLAADKLLVLSNVPGVMSSMETREVIASLTTVEARALMESGAIKKGMLPKLTAAVRAVENGVRQATILSGMDPHALLAETFTDRGSGTLITRPGTPPTVPDSEIPKRKIKGKRRHTSSKKRKAKRRRR
jgi:acetylglutamate kinase